MSGKFMKIKKIIIPTLTVIMIASGLCACSSCSQSEALKMINNGEQIELEVATLEHEEKGTEADITWTELAKLDTYSDFRTAFENAMEITVNGGLKEGVVYVDLEGKQTNNSTMYNAFMNSQFISKWNDETIQSQLNDGISTTYADLEDSDHTAAILNAYFNLLDDNQPNYFNGGASLTRGEAMTMLMRAVTPVEDLKTNDNFKSLVGDNKYTGYASYMDSYSFISSSDKSINEQNFNGAMTRAEFVYMVMNYTFGKETVSNYDSSKVSLNDCKNAGDIAKTEEFSGKDYCNSYVLRQMINNPDLGATTEIYQALAMAKDIGIIGSETRFDESISKTEGIEIIASAFNAYVTLNGSQTEVGTGELADYTEQAKALYESNKEDWSCTEEEFISAYTTYINQGLSVDEVELQLEADYNKEKQEEQSKDNAQLENNTENETMENGQKYYYARLGLKLGWNDSGEMGFSAGDYIYVYRNGDIYYFMNEADKNSFDINNPNKKFLIYTESEGLRTEDNTGSVGTETPTQQPTTEQQTTTSKQEGSSQHTEETTTSTNTEDWEQGELFDPSKNDSDWDGEGGYDPNDQ